MLPPWLNWIQRVALLITALLFSAGYAAVGLAFVLLTVIAEGTITRTLPWARSSGDLYLASFLLVFLLSGWISAYRPVAVASAGLAALTIFLAFGTLYRQLRQDPRFLVPFLWVWVAGAVGTAIWAGSLHRLTGRPAFTPGLGQNAVGTTLLIGLVLSVGLFLTRRGTASYLAAGAAAVLVPSLALTNTRGAWIGTAVGLLSLLVLAKLRYAWRAVVLLCLVCGIGIALTFPERAALLQRVSTITDIAANRFRVAQLTAVRAIFTDHPILGTGLNTFALVYPHYRVPDDPNPATLPFAHNIFLDMAAEGGTLGVVTFSATILWAAVAGWRWHSGSATLDERLLAATILSAYAGTMVHQLFDGTMISVHLGSGVWFLIAVLTGSQSSHSPARSAT